MAVRTDRSITLPIVMGVIAVPLTLALLVGWIWVLIRNIQLTQQVVAQGWLMAAGALSGVVIVTVLVLFSVFLAREIREGQRQVRFIDSVTHELKSPLAAMKLCVQTLDRRELTAPQRHQLHQMMLDDIDRLSAFIDDVLESSRVGYGPNDHTVVEVSIPDLIRRAAERVAERHGLTMEAFQIQEDPPGIMARTDPTSLEIVIRNLLDNAVKYSEKPASVWVRISAVRGRRVEIAVSDKGIGIPPDQLKRVFDRFYRVPSEDVKRRRGTGLGLYVASTLVRNMGGRLIAASAGPGTGTTMRFELPNRMDIEEQASQ